MTDLELADELERWEAMLTTECEGDQGALAEFGEFVLGCLPAIIAALQPQGGEG